MTFDDLTFEPHHHFPDGRRARAFFANGYGASVIQSQYSYGGPEGLFELGVLRGDLATGFGLTYDTPITGDVVGDLTEAGVTRLLGEIEALPARVEAY